MKSIMKNDNIKQLSAGSNKYSLNYEKNEIDANIEDHVSSITAQQERKEQENLWRLLP